MPEFVGLPLEFWPGYRRRAASDSEERAAAASALKRDHDDVARLK
jgi:hypothetical protein